MSAGTWGRLEIRFSVQNFIIIMLNHDSSSKLCFEEKSPISSFVINVMWFSKLFQLWSSSGAALVAFAEIPCQLSLQKIDKIHHQLKKSKETNKNRVYLKKCKVPKSATLESGFVKRKSNSFVYIRYFHIQQIHLHARIIKEAEENHGGRNQGLKGRNCGEVLVAVHWTLGAAHITVVVHRAVSHCEILNWCSAHNCCGTLGLCRGAQGQNSNFVIASNKFQISRSHFPHVSSNYLVITIKQCLVLFERGI